MDNLGIRSGNAAAEGEEEMGMEESEGDSKEERE